MVSITLAELVAKAQKEQQYQDVFPELLREIRVCLEQELYLAALALTLMLPDVCGIAKYPDESVASRYIKWYNEYIGQHEKPTNKHAEDMPYLSGEVVYNLRNGLLHSANPAIEKNKVKEENNRLDCLELVFGNEPEGDMKHVVYSGEHRIIYREYTLFVKSFCLKVCKAADEYYLNNRNQFGFFTHKISLQNW